MRVDMIFFEKAMLVKKVILYALNWLILDMRFVSPSTIHEFYDVALICIKKEKRYGRKKLAKQFFLKK